MTITQSTPHIFVGMDLAFEEPFAGSAVSTLAVEPVAEGSTVTWSMDMPTGFVAKAFGLLMDLEGTLAADYDRGLAALKSHAEADAQAQADVEAAERAAAEAESAAATKALEQAFRDALEGAGADLQTVDW